MRVKKITSFLFVFVMLYVASMPAVSAEEPAADVSAVAEPIVSAEEQAADVPGAAVPAVSVEKPTADGSPRSAVSTDEKNMLYEIYINGTQYNGDVYLKNGEECTVSVRVSCDNKPVEDKNIKCDWWIQNKDNSVVEQEKGNSSYTFTYNGQQAFAVTIITDLDGEEEDYRFGPVSLKEDAKTVLGQVTSASSDFSVTTKDNIYTYEVDMQNVSRGSSGVLNVNVDPSDNVQYSWMHQIVNSEYVWENLSETSSTYSFNKNSAGTEIYTCIVSDDTGYRKEVVFTLNPEDTLQIGMVTIDGAVPTCVGSIGDNGIGYHFGTKEGKNLELAVKAETKTNSEINYKWYHSLREAAPEVVGTASKQSITKADEKNSTYEPASDGSVRGVEDFECWIDDGNMAKRVLLTLYLVDQISDTKTAAIANDLTEDFDTFLKPTDAYADVQKGSLVSRIKLDTAEKKEADLSIEDKAKIAGAFSLENGEVGMYLDINLQAQVVTVTRGFQVIDKKDVPITETGRDVSITVNIPQGMLDAQGNVKDGQYQVVRLHNGKNGKEEVKALDCRTNTVDKTITFDTNKFSLYALAYTEGGTGAGSTSGQTGTASDSQKNPGAAASVGPKTGDMSDAGRYAVLGLLAAAAMAGALIKRKAHGN